MTLTALDFPASPTNGQLYPDPPVTGQPQYSWNGTQWLSSKAAVTQIARTDALGWSGMQINGSMDVSQEWGQATKSIASLLPSTYAIDGWGVSCDAATYAGNVLQTSTSVPAGFGNSFIVMVTTGSGAPPSGTWFELHTAIEGYRIARLAWGSANAQPITLGFWVKASRAGLHSGAIRSASPFRSYAFTYTINAANTWEYNTVTIPGDTAGTWNTTNGTGASVIFNIASGTSQLGTPGVWATQNVLGAIGSVNNAQNNTDYFQLTGVVVLPGIEAPTAAQSPLIMRPFDQELVTCKRYYYRSSSTGIYMRGWVTSASAILVTHNFDRMRSSPSLSIYGNATDNLIQTQSGNYTTTSFTPTIISDEALTVTAAGGTMTGLTPAQPTHIKWGHSGPSGIALDARL